MMRIKSDFSCLYLFVFSLIFALPLFGCAQNIVDQKPARKLLPALKLQNKQ